MDASSSISPVSASAALASAAASSSTTPETDESESWVSVSAALRQMLLLAERPVAEEGPEKARNDTEPNTPETDYHILIVDQYTRYFRRQQRSPSRIPHSTIHPITGVFQLTKKLVKLDSTNTSAKKPPISTVTVAWRDPYYATASFGTSIPNANATPDSVFHLPRESREEYKAAGVEKLKYMTSTTTLPTLSFHSTHQFGQCAEYQCWPQHKKAMIEAARERRAYDLKSLSVKLDGQLRELCDRCRWLAEEIVNDPINHTTTIQDIATEKNYRRKGWLQPEISPPIADKFIAIQKTRSDEPRMTGLPIGGLELGRGKSEPLPSEVDKIWETRSKRVKWKNLVKKYDIRQALACAQRTKRLDAETLVVLALLTDESFENLGAMPIVLHR
ncbi:hypothetical protein C8J56DRAFT_1040922 [Mycena floridula]|nr:hypothetical protein C8J56DRAFT_1040922 [Mycena floridula]